MMATLGELWWQHLRLTVLRTLATAAGCEANDSLLTDVIRSPDFGFSALTRDQVGAALEWLAEQGLVTLAAPGGLNIARLTPRGEDVAAGRVEVAGVKRPSLRG